MRLRELRAAKGKPVDPLELPPPLNELPWEEAQKEFGVKGADFLGQFGRVVLKGLKKQLPIQPMDFAGKSVGLQTGFG
jgi:hypothetical protein